MFQVVNRLEYALREPNMSFYYYCSCNKCSQFQPNVGRIENCRVENLYKYNQFKRHKNKIIAVQSM